MNSPADGLLAGLRAGMRVGGDVLVQLVHEGPALLLAHQLQPGRDHQIAGAGRGRVRHDDLPLVFGLGQVGPARRLRQALRLGLDRVEAERRRPDVHADPARRVGGIAHQRLDVGEPGRRVGHEHALLLQQHQRGRGQAHHDVGLRIVLLRQQLGGDDAGRIAHPLDVDVGIGGLEGRLVGLELIGLERRIDEKFRRGVGRRRKREKCREPDGRGADFVGHVAVPVVEEVCSLG